APVTPFACRGADVLARKNRELPLNADRQTSCMALRVRRPISGLDKTTRKSVGCGHRGYFRDRDCRPACASCDLRKSPSSSVSPAIGGTKSCRGQIHWLCRDSSSIVRELDPALGVEPSSRTGRLRPTGRVGENCSTVGRDYSIQAGGARTVVAHH